MLPLCDPLKCLDHPACLNVQHPIADHQYDEHQKRQRKEGVRPGHHNENHKVADLENERRANQLSNQNLDHPV